MDGTCVAEAAASFPEGTDGTVADPSCVVEEARRTASVLRARIRKASRRCRSIPGRERPTDYLRDVSTRSPRRALLNLQNTKVLAYPF